MKTRTPAASNFLSKRTPEHDKAIVALEKVFDKYGARDAEGTYATALSDRFLEHWKRSENVTQSRARPCVQRIRGKKCTYLQAHCECTPPGADHMTMWSKNGKPTFYISQPYQLDMETLEEMNKFCKDNGLTYRIFSRGFYYPGAALFVLYSAARGGN